MSIYEKLQSIRIKLQKCNLKKSGENKFAGYKYYELGDFLPKAMELFYENKLFSYVSFTHEQATLTIINTENPEEIVVITSPMGEASLKGCHQIQNIGAVQTYQRRYLYMAVLELTENDILDASDGNQNKPKQSSSDQNASEKQLSMIFALSKELQISTDSMKKHINEKYGVASSKELTKKQASEVIEYLNGLKSN